MKTMYVYILECSDKSFYTGVTNNLERRLTEHEAGTNRNSYTFGKRPLRLMYYEMFSSPKQAIQFEKKIKGWSRIKKQALIDQNWDKIKEYSKCVNSTSHLTFKKE